MVVFLGHIVLRALASLRHLPVDVLVRSLDVACLTVDAAVAMLVTMPSTQSWKVKVHLLLRIDLEPHAVRLGLVLNILIHASWAEAILHTLIRRVCSFGVGIPVLDLQVNRLILLVVGSSAGDTCQDIKGDLAIRLLVLNLRDLVGRKGRCVVRGLMLECPRNTTLQDISLEA